MIFENDKLDRKVYRFVSSSPFFDASDRQFAITLIYTLFAREEVTADSGVHAKYEEDLWQRVIIFRERKNAVGIWEIIQMYFQFFILSPNT